MTVPIPHDQVEQNILLIRGHRVMLDADLAKLYGVTTKRLNEQVLRNRKRFPSDFMLQLTLEEAERLRSQFATFERRDLPARSASAEAGNAAGGLLIYKAALSGAVCLFRWKLRLNRNCAGTGQR